MLQCPCVSPWQSRWLPQSRWSKRPTHNCQCADYLVRGHSVTSDILYWSHRPVLNQCAKKLYKERNTLRQTSMGTVLEAGYPTILFVLQTYRANGYLRALHLLLAPSEWKEIFPLEKHFLRFMETLVPHFIQLTTQCYFFEPEFPDHLV